MTKSTKSTKSKIKLAGVGTVRAATGIDRDELADVLVDEGEARRIGLRGQGGSVVMVLSAYKDGETRKIGSIRQVGKNDYRISLRESKSRWAGLKRSERVALRTARFASLDAADQAFQKFMRA